MLKKFKLVADDRERSLQDHYKKKGSVLREGVEKVIKVEEDKVNAKLEEERKRREALEKKRREEEEKRRLEAERKRQEEEKRRKEEEEKVKEKMQEEEEERKRLEEEKRKVQELKAFEEERKRLGLTLPEEDWKKARVSLKVQDLHPIVPLESTNELSTIETEIRSHEGGERQQAIEAVMEHRSAGYDSENRATYERHVYYQSNRTFYGCLESLLCPLMLIFWIVSIHCSDTAAHTCPSRELISRTPLFACKGHSPTGRNRGHRRETQCHSSSSSYCHFPLDT